MRSIGSSPLPDLRRPPVRDLAAAALLGLALAPSAAAQVITNGGFESGLAGWTTADQLGGNGSFAIQSGGASPVNGFPVPTPPQGLAAAMSDAEGPGSHVLYQDIVIPPAPGPALLVFELFVRNEDGAEDFFVPVPSSLDFATPTLNQQARVDIMT